MLKISQLNQMNGQRNLHSPGYGCMRLQMLPSSVAFGFPSLLFSYVAETELKKQLALTVRGRKVDAVI